MKKCFLFMVLIFLFSQSIYSNDIREKFNGIWYLEDRVKGNSALEALVNENLTWDGNTGEYAHNSELIINVDEDWIAIGALGGPFDIISFIKVNDHFYKMLVYYDRPDIETMYNLFWNDDGTFWASKSSHSFSFPSGSMNSYQRVIGP